ncbi:hypothetical protein DPM13_09450 [Paracoccus mutanolyticus]|uniref:HTH cro/C1-type domain-containing protein n=1 Tax=Paracoccus mutanolyticus TaxID=1499308 RepID=A0ABM6WRF6_9RHOB|nr:hypothetical protein DPM13_09450 [Paracoccus mutanolyticus]
MNTLRATRRSCGLTQASVAASAGISLPTLRALERGEGGVRALAAVMAVLDLRWGWAPDRVLRQPALADQSRGRGDSRQAKPARIGVTRSGCDCAGRDLGATAGDARQGRGRAWRLGSAVSRGRHVRAGRAGARQQRALAQDLVMTPPELAAG